MRGRWLISGVIAAGLGMTGAGHAQIAASEETTGVQDQAQPVPVPEGEEPASPQQSNHDDADPYEPLGLRSGGMTLFSTLETLATVSSNINQKKSGENAGVGLIMRPSLSFESDWARHSWTGEASADLLRYLDHSELATTSATAETDFRLDIRRTTRAEFSASYDLAVDANIDTGVTGSEIGDATEHTAAAAAGLIHNFGPMEMALRSGIERGIFEDVALSGGGSQDNGDQDYWAPSMNLRASYTDPPLLKPFVEVGYERRIHDRNVDRNGEDRDSHGLSLRAGVALDDGPIWSGELAATYLLRKFDDANLGSNDAVGLDGSLTWSPTELTSITFNFGTELSDSSDAGDVGGQSWSAGAEFKQALRDNLDLLAGAGLTIEDETAGTDLTYDASLGLTWSLTRNVALTAVYDFTLLDAAAAAESYTEHRISAGVVLRH